MRWVCVGDVHYRPTTPRARTDDYVATLLGKMDQVRKIAQQYSARNIILPGDVFDNPTPPMWLLGAVIGQCAKLRTTNHNLFAVAGQHDQRYHSTPLENTPLGVLRASGMVHLLGASPLEATTRDFGDTHVYGAGWNSPIPQIQNPDVINILVMHRMVLGSKKLWEQQQDYSWSRHVLRRNKFDLIVTGDNHTFFTDEVPSSRGPRFLVNCGSLMRSNVDQATHKPAVVVYDARERTLEVVPLKVAPAKKVLSAEVAARAKEQSAELEAFVDQIGDTSIAPELNFLSNVDKLKQAAGDDAVAAMVDQIISMGE